MKFLLINPNTSQFVTDRVAESARLVARKETEIKAVTGTQGAAIVSTRSECALAKVEALRLAAKYAHGCDGILLAISFDTGLDELREVLDIPVVGMSEAGMLAAMTISRRFSLLTFGNRAVPLYSELVRHYGFEERSAGVISLPPLSPGELENTNLVIPALIERIEQAADEDGSEAIVLAGAVFAGIAEVIRKQVSIPVIDGIAAGIHTLQMLHALEPRKPLKGSYQYPPAEQLTGVIDTLTAKVEAF